MSDLVVDRQMLIDMLRRPEFYAACPAYAHLAEVAAQSWRERQAAAATGCPICEGDDFKYMRGIVDAFWTRTLELKRDKESARLAEVRQWLLTRKRGRYSRVVLYYRRSRTQGKIAKIVL